MPFLSCHIREPQNSQSHIPYMENHNCLGGYGHLSKENFHVLVFEIKICTEFILFPYDHDTYKINFKN